MALLPREMVTQRHPTADVSVPGTRLWSSATDLALCSVVNTDVVEDGEVEAAQAAPPLIEWWVEWVSQWDPSLGTTYNDVRPGVYQRLENITTYTPYGSGLYGAGLYGGAVVQDDMYEWYVEHGPTYWVDDNADDGF